MNNDLEKLRELTQKLRNAARELYDHLESEGNWPDIWEQNARWAVEHAETMCEFEESLRMV